MLPHVEVHVITATIKIQNGSIITETLPGVGYWVTTLYCSPSPTPTIPVRHLLFCHFRNAGYRGSFSLHLLEILFFIPCRNLRFPHIAVCSNRVHLDVWAEVFTSRDKLLLNTSLCNLQIKCVAILYMWYFHKYFSLWLEGYFLSGIKYSSDLPELLGVHLQLIKLLQVFCL